MTVSLIAAVKARLPLQDLVAETFTVVGHGPTLTTAEHDSLKLRTDWQTWRWYSRGLSGDIFDWYQLQHRCDFATALAALAQRAGLAAPDAGESTAGVGKEALHARRQTAILELAAAHYHALLLSPAGQAARDYCYRRGWTDATLAREQLGYVPALAADDKVSPLHDLAPLHRQLREADLHDHPAAKAVLMLPPNSLVYVHRARGRVVYLSTRSLTHKRHWNPPADLVGPRRPYHADPAPGAPGARLPGVHVLVEGQADAVSLGQLGIAATALCGLGSPLGAPADFAGSPHVAVTHVGLDADEAGRARALDLALSLHPTIRIVTWPAGKDANDWLLTHPAPAVVANLFTTATPALLALAATIPTLHDDARAHALRRLLDAYAALDDLAAADLKPDLAAALGEGVAHFNRLLKARAGERAKNGDAPNAADLTRYAYSAGLARHGLLFEQVVWEESGEFHTAYAVRRPTGDVEIQPSVEIGPTTYLPFPVDMGLIAKEVVLFPARPADYGAPRDLVRRVQAFIHTYLDVDPFYERLAAYYVLLTWLYDLFETLPYLRALGDYGTGKTRFLHAIGSLCYRPMFVSGASTTSPIFRIIDMFQGTLVIDEADFGNSDAEAEIIKILNVGYYRGGVVLRSEKDPTAQHDDYWPAAKSVYGPKILATRRPFTDRATESRCLTKRTTTARPRPGIPFILGRAFWQEAQALRNQLLLYRLHHHRPIDLDPALADTSVEPRLNQVTLAIKAMVDDPAMRSEIDLFIRAYNEQLIADRQMTLPAIVVQALTDLYAPPQPTLTREDDRDFSMKAIADRAQALINEVDPGTLITAKRVGQILSEELGLTTRRRNPRHRRAELVVTAAELAALQVRYGVPAADERDRVGE